MKVKLMAASALAVAAFAAQGAAPAQAAPAQVPCTPGSGGHVYCTFWAAGNGYSGGSPVLEGWTLMGYLPQGRNWIICQEQGPEFSTGSYHNIWYAWTTAENGNQGWVNAVWGSGGDNNGKFSNTPSCNGAHGSPF